MQKTSLVMWNLYSGSKIFSHARSMVLSTWPNAGLSSGVKHRLSSGVQKQVVWNVGAQMAPKGT